MAETPKPTAPTPTHQALRDLIATKGYDYEALKNEYEKVRTLWPGSGFSHASGIQRLLPFDQLDETSLPQVETILTQGSQGWADRGIRGPEELKAAAKQATVQQAAQNQFEALFHASLADQGKQWNADTKSIEDIPGHPQAEVRRLATANTLAALHGDLPVDPALEYDLKQGEVNLRNALHGQLGPGYETSTPGIEALSKYRQRADQTRFAARRSDVQQFSGLSAALRGEGRGTEPNLAAANLGQANLGYQANLRQTAGENLIRQQEIQAQRDAAEQQAQYGLYSGIANLGLTAALGFSGYGGYRKKMYGTGRIQPTPYMGPYGDT